MKALERTYRKSERVVSKARFTYVVFLRELLIAAILGGIIAVLYIYKADINKLVGKDIMTDQILQYVTAGCAGLVLILCIIEGISKWQKEVVVTATPLFTPVLSHSSVNSFLTSIDFIRWFIHASEYPNRL